MGMDNVHNFYSGEKEEGREYERLLYGPSSVCILRMPYGVLCLEYCQAEVCLVCQAPAVDSRREPLSPPSFPSSSPTIHCN